MVDGFGFCYYWVIEGFRLEDFNYKFSEFVCNVEVILDYIYGFIMVVFNLVKGLFNVWFMIDMFIIYEEKCWRILFVFKEVSDILRNSKLCKMNDFKVVF